MKQPARPNYKPPPKQQQKKRKKKRPPSADAQAAAPPRRHSRSFKIRHLIFRKDQLRQPGVGFLAGKDGTAQESLVTDWADSYLRAFSQDHPELRTLHVCDQQLQCKGLKYELPNNETVSSAYQGTLRQLPIVLIPGTNSSSAAQAVPTTCTTKMLPARPTCRPRIAASGAWKPAAAPPISPTSTTARIIIGAPLRP